MLTNQHTYIYQTYYHYIFFALLASCTSININSSEMKSNADEVINNTAHKPTAIINHHAIQQEKQPKITPAIDLSCNKHESPTFEKRLNTLFKYTQYSFLIRTPYQSYADKLLMQPLKDLKIHSVHDFLNDIHARDSKILWKLNHYPHLKQLTRFIADHWYLLENINQLLESFLAKKYQLSSQEVSFLRRELYDALAVLLYLPKQEKNYPFPITEKLQKVQQELFAILKFLEQIYCALGTYDPCITQAIVENTITISLTSIKEALLSKNGAPLARYYEDNKEGLERISKLKTINHLPNLSCQNYFSGAFAKNVEKELSLIYHNNTNQSNEKDRKKLLKIVDENFLSENDIKETLDNLSSLDNPSSISEYLDDSEQRFCNQSNIKNSLEAYKQWLTSSQLLAFQLDRYLYQIAAHKEYHTEAYIYFFQKTKSLYFIRYFKNLLFQKMQKEILKNHNEIYLKGSLLSTPFSNQLSTVVIYCLDLQMNQLLLKPAVSIFKLTAEEEQTIQNYTFYESCSKNIPALIRYPLDKMSEKQLKGWKNYLTNVNCLNPLVRIWHNMGYTYAPHHFLALIGSHIIKKKSTTCIDYYTEFKKMLQTNFNTISNIYKNTTKESEQYILKGINQILVNPDQNYLTSSTIIAPFFDEYISSEEYFYDQQDKIAYLILQVIFPNTYQKVIKQLIDQGLNGWAQLYELRKDIQTKNSKILTKQFIASLSKQSNAQEEIVKRINIYIESKFLFETILFVINQGLKHISWHNNPASGFYTSFAKHQIEAFKCLFKKILGYAISSGQALDVLRDPLKYSTNITNSKEAINIMRPASILSNLDLKCYQKMLLIILNLNKINKHKDYEKWWSIVVPHLIMRGHTQTIHSHLQNTVYLISHGKQESVTGYIPLDVRIFTQYMSLIQQYLSIIDRLCQRGSGIPKHYLAKVILFILEKEAEKIVKNPPKELLAENILSIDHMKLLMNQKGALQLKLSQNEWKKIKNIVKPKQVPVQFLRPAIIGSQSKKQSRIRNFGSSGNHLMLTGEMHTSPAIKSYKINFADLGELGIIHPSYTIEKNQFSAIKYPDQHETYKKMYHMLFTYFPKMQDFSVIACKCNSKRHIICHGNHKGVYMVGGFNLKKNLYENQFTLPQTCPWVKQLAQKKSRIPAISFRGNMVESWLSSCIYAWSNTLNNTSKTQNSSHLGNVSFKSYYWWENKYYLAMYFLAVTGFKQEVKIKSYSMYDNKLLNTYHLVLPNGCHDLYIKGLGQQYFIIAVVGNNIHYKGSIFLFKKSQKNCLDSLENLGALHDMRYWAYSPDMELLFIQSSEESIDAYSLSSGKYKKLTNPGDIKGKIGIISPKNYTKQSFLFITVTIGYQQFQYHIHRYKVKMDHNKATTIQKMQKVKLLEIPINRVVDHQDRFSFKIFCSPKQPNSLFLITLEKLLLINQNTWVVESSIPILQSGCIDNGVPSDDGIIFKGYDYGQIYALTWDQLKEFTTQK